MASHHRRSLVSNDSYPRYRYHFYSGPDLSSGPVRGKIVYCRRWVIVTMFSILSLIQGVEWNSWWFISKAPHNLYNWTYGSIILLGCIAALALALSLIPTAKITVNFGQRGATIIGVMLLVIGAFSRYWYAISCKSLAYPIISSVIIGMCGAVTYIGPTVISASWFPRKERFVATAIMIFAGTAFAMCCSFLISDSLLPKILPNVTLDNSTIHVVNRELDRVYLVEFLFCLVVCSAILIYFPNLPPTPPSFSATIPRRSLSLSIREALNNPTFWFLGVARMFPYGTQVYILRALRFEMTIVGITELDCMWLGPSTCLVATIGGIGFALVANRFPFRTKSILVGLNAASGAASLLLTLTCFRILAPDDESTRTFFFVSVLLTAFFSSATVPLYAEMVCEVTYPASEACVQAIHGVGFAVTWAICFNYFITSSVWVLATLTGGYILCVPLILCARGQMHRVDEDLEDGCL